MKKTYKSLFSCFCVTAALAVSGLMTVQADSSAAPADTIRIYGPVTKTENEALLMDNQARISYPGDILLNLSDKTLILDAVTGYPVSFSDIENGETVYAYIGPAMTMSLPPMTNPSVIFCNIPEGFRVPEFLQTDSLSIHADGISGSVTATNGTTYTIPADCQIIPYLTRNIVSIRDLANGRTFMLWSDDQNNAAKIVIFPDETISGLLNTGWSQENNQWFYYNADGTLFKGWLQDGSDWYYLDPSTGVMQTGFLTLEGRTYFLLEDGRMLTEARTFTPDANGALH